MTLPASMTAVEIAGRGGPEVLKPVQMPLPAPGSSQLLIRVEAAGVNRPDVLQRQGAYPPPPGASPIPGLEVAGIIAAKGAKTSRYQVGDMVTALVTGGGYAQYCVAEESAALPFPERFDAVLSAALPETYFTVWHNLFFRGGLMAGETLLVHGGASGIGTTAIQIAKAFGATVFTTAGTAEKCEFCEKLGADLAIHYREQDFVAAVKERTGGKGADVILDMVGGDYVQRNLHAVAEDGRIHQIAFLQGASVTVDLTRLMIRRITLTGSTLRPRSTAVKAQLARALEDQVWPLLSNGTVRPVIETVFPLEQAAEAHRLMESGSHTGKIMLSVS